MRKQHDRKIPATLPLLRWIDAVLIIVLVLICVLTIPTLRSVAPDKVVLFKENRVLATYPLDTDQEIKIQGNSGLLTIIIKNRSVRVLHSNCPHGVCQKTGSISKPHSQIVCAPNHVVISITSTKKDTLDGVAR